jgi:hypothetical protein
MFRSVWKNGVTTHPMFTYKGLSWRNTTPHPHFSSLWAREQFRRSAATEDDEPFLALGADLGGSRAEGMARTDEYGRCEREIQAAIEMRTAERGAAIAA